MCPCRARRRRSSTLNLASTVNDVEHLSRSITQKIQTIVLGYGGILVRQGNERVVDGSVSILVGCFDLFLSWPLCRGFGRASSFALGRDLCSSRRRHGNRCRANITVVCVMRAIYAATLTTHFVLLWLPLAAFFRRIVSSMPERVQPLATRAVVSSV
jgi:hypothetical protein